MRICNVWDHFSIITRYRNLVKKHCFRIGLYWQGLTHNLSEYGPEKFWTGVRYYQGNRNPNTAECETVGYSRVQLHRKGRNKYHYEYRIDISNHKEEGLVGNKMPLRYVVEVICDRIAACEMYEGKAYASAAPLEYCEYTKDYITVHPQTRALLEKPLHVLKDQGKEAAFTYLRKLLKKGTH